MNIGSVLNILIDKNGTVALQASQNKMDFVNSWLLMSSPINPAIILATYLMFVLKIGPTYMKDRKPYQLTNLITIYNAVQVAISLYLIYGCGRMLAIYGVVPKTCVLDTEFSRQGIASGMHYYLLAKVSELLDTVFFVLRKKTRQLSFLHIYHHTLMVVVTWSALKYEPTIHLLVLGVVNSFIHVVMYTYYGLSSFPSLAKYLWWKKYITSLQLIQFIIVLTIFTVAAKVSECTPSIVLTIALSMNAVLFFYLFGKFYLNNYTKSKAKENKISNGSKYTVNGTTNGVNGYNKSEIIVNDCSKNGVISSVSNGDNITNSLYNFKDDKRIKQS